MDYSIGHIEQNNVIYLLTIPNIYQILNNLGVTIVSFNIDVPSNNITSYNQILIIC